VSVLYQLSARIGDKTARKEYLSWSAVMHAVSQVADKALPFSDRDRVKVSVAKGTKGTGCWSDKGDSWHLTVCRLPDRAIFVPGEGMLEDMLEDDPTDPRGKK
jgi:hypothetical protein